MANQPKTRNVKPKERHKRLLVEIPKHKTMKEAMIAANYSESVAENPNLVLQTKGFRELWEEAFPDVDLQKVMREGLEATKVISATVFPEGKDGKPVNDFIDVPDHAVRHRYLETVLKVTKRLSPEIIPDGLPVKAISINVYKDSKIIQVVNKANAELDLLIEQQIKKRG